MLLMDTLVKTALNAMSSVKKPQKTFITLLLSTLIVVQGKSWLAHGYSSHFAPDAGHQSHGSGCGWST